MANILGYVTDKEKSEFYPTPENLVQRMIEKVDWLTVQSILEPSAGKGDILKGVARKLSGSRSNIEVDAIEIDPNIRAILKYNFSEEAEESLRDERKQLTGGRGYSEKDWSSKKYKYYDGESRTYQFYSDDIQKKLEEVDNKLNAFFSDGLHIVHDNFLTYTNYKQYGAIIMNPPFSSGDKHLLKALEMQKHGGQIVCLLNAETIRNPYTALRQHLVQQLNEYNADIEYISDAFSDAERKADVEIALIYVNIPYADSDNGSSIYDKLAKAKQYEEPTPEQAMELEVVDFIQMIVNRYKVEVESGIELIKTFQRMKPYLWNNVNESDKYKRQIIQLSDGDGHEMTVNRYVKKVRLKYWEALLSNEKFIGKLTSKLQNEYRQRICDYANYDFSEFNIYTLLTEMNAQIKTGIEEEIEKMYDRLTEEHSYYPECKKNRYLYDGWKTNKAWKLEKKSIIPCYGVFDRWDGKPRIYEIMGVLSDIERVLNFFDGNMTEEINLANQLERSFSLGVTKNIECKFFNITVYKKGTVHITFTCPELIDRYNIYCAKQRKWLPPSYGTKKYEDMTTEEQSVIDSFQGKQAYEKVMQKKDYYLAPPVDNNNVLMLEIA